MTFLFSCPVVSNSLWPRGLQHARPPCPSPSPRACSNSCPSGRWCQPTILSSVVHFSSCLQSFPASGSFPMCWLFASGGQSIRASASASVLPTNIQGWSPLGLTGLISLIFLLHQEALEFLFAFCHKDVVICISEVIDRVLNESKCVWQFNKWVWFNPSSVCTLLSWSFCC